MAEQSKLEKIAKRAYELFEARGGQHGSDLEDWLKAEREVSQQERRSAPVQARLAPAPAARPAPAAVQSRPATAGDPRRKV